MEEIHSGTTQQPPRHNQTSNRFEGEIPSSSTRPQAELETDSHNTSSPPVVPLESNEKLNQRAEEPALPVFQIDPESSPPTVPIILDDKLPPESTRQIDSSEYNDFQKSRSIENSSDDESEYAPSDLPIQSDCTHEGNNTETIDNQQRKLIIQEKNNNINLDRQNDTGQVIGPPDTKPEKYDMIMTGLDEIPHIAGQKRTRSLESEMTRSKRGRPTKKVDYYRLHHGTAARLSSDPKTWLEAMSSKEAKQWHQAAIDECRSLKETGTIEVIPRSKLPKGRKLMKFKWVFKKKFLADGSHEKYRARCTVKGYNQRSDIDYKETFAPTPRAETGRIMLVLAHRFGWYRKQGDVPGAFLNPNLDVDLYMEMPEGFQKKEHIIRIHKGLYGLKQAAALWYDDVRVFLAKNGMFPTITDVCLYTNKQKDLFAIVHVDDFQVMGPNIDKIEKLMKALHNKYKLKSVETDLFLGIHISNPDKYTLKLSQGQYARRLLARHGLENCKSVRKPLEQMMEPNNTQCSKQKMKEYNSIIDGLQYLANNTRPDITHAVNHLARFLANPSDDHISAAKRILRYISGDPDKGIIFKSGRTKPILEAYSDADFAGDPETTRSTTGSLKRLASGPVCWKFHLQREVVLSTTEAEYLAATETCRELEWVKSLLQELELQDRIEGVA